MTFTRESELVEVSAIELQNKLDRVLLIDVREPGEYSSERIPGAKLMPLSKFDCSQIPADQEVVLYCRTGTRSAQAAEKIFATGVKQSNIYREELLLGNNKDCPPIGMQMLPLVYSGRYKLWQVP